ncbi:unnamed protein product [Miscanthus lutarioriparius]|uniref:Uncharacterized protein n=1 Tax=Miscanthus lutarioriparius TaxID=422564 RepID=A0A811P168_9POAL|nr:unnamed protein product [Miscanthus lutarioriparius]
MPGVESSRDSVPVRLSAPSEGGSRDPHTGSPHHRLPFLSLPFLFLPAQSLAPSLAAKLCCPIPPPHLRLFKQPRSRASGHRSRLAPPRASFPAPAPYAPPLLPLTSHAPSGARIPSLCVAEEIGRQNGFGFASEGLISEVLSPKRASLEHNGGGEELECGGHGGVHIRRDPEFFFYGLMEGLGEWVGRVSEMCSTGRASQCL